MSDVTLPMLRLLNRSWQSICFKYYGLTPNERECLSQDEFDSIISLMGRHGFDIICTHGYDCVR